MDAPPPPSRVTHVRQVNANTCFAGGAQWAPAAPLDEAYRSALAVQRTLTPMQEPGYRLFDVGSGVRSWLDLPAKRDVFAIAGRHSCCDLRLEGDPEVALRHLLVRSQLAAGGEVPMLRLLDLYTQQGFRLDANAMSQESSALVVGPLAMYVGKNALVALPSQSRGLPEELPRVVVDPIASSPYRSLASNAPVPAVPCWTHVSLYPRPPSVHELRSTRGMGGQLGGKDRPAPSGLARFALERDGKGECIEVTDSELGRGILIGRASKCDHRFGSLLDEKVSRVHLLVMQDDGETVAVDLASTNGTYFHGKRMRRVVLPDAGARVGLGLSGVRLHWHPRS